MRKETSEWSIRMLIDLENRINVDAEYQRGKVWSEPQQALLIDSLLRNFDIPKIFLRKRSGESKYLFDVIDGKQRLTAIWPHHSSHDSSRHLPQCPGLGASHPGMALLLEQPAPSFRLEGHRRCYPSQSPTL